jgi:hypothetical protein
MSDLMGRQMRKKRTGADVSSVRVYCRARSNRYTASGINWVGEVVERDVIFHLQP